MLQTNDNRIVTLPQWLVAILGGAGLAAVIWWGLLTGGGLNGGDTYSYFFPQKIVVANCLTHGDLPLWHNLTGLGYPLHAESQAAIFYPTTQILYRLLDVNTAYNVSIILHYCLAFVFTWRFARCQNLSHTSALMAASVFVYGWFPARISLEWSIIGGLWMPLALWQTDRLIVAPSRRRFATLAVCLTLHLLAGHFTLAFVTQLTIIGYAWCRRPLTTQEPHLSRWKRTGLVVGCITAGLFSAAIQLAPTFELKLNSQREGAGDAFDPAYGHMPPAYITQIAASWWYWHTPEIKATGKLHSLPGTIDADTNAVEAHLYWGIIPLGLLLTALNHRLRGRADREVMRIWLILSGLALLYATGWLLPVTRHLPGFGFFMGPGRYTIVTALGGSIVAGLMLDAVLAHTGRSASLFITLMIIAITLLDLTVSSRAIADAFVVEQPPIQRLDQSWVRKALANSDRQPVRLLAPGPNVCNLYGVSCVPQYLGIGPSAYFTPELRPPTQPEQPTDLFPDESVTIQLSRLAVTHLLATERIQNPADTLELIGQFPDAFLNSVWGRGASPVYLYEFKTESGRIRPSASEALKSVRIQISGTSEVVLDVDLTGDACLTLAELASPGWSVTVDENSAPTCNTVETVLRSVSVPPGKHVVRWSYSPLSFKIGGVVSVMAWLTLLAMIILSPTVTGDSPNAMHSALPRNESAAL